MFGISPFMLRFSCLDNCLSVLSTRSPALSTCLLLRLPQPGQKHPPWPHWSQHDHYDLFLGASNHHSAMVRVLTSVQLSYPLIAVRGGRVLLSLPLRSCSARFSPPLLAFALVGTARDIENPKKGLSKNWETFTREPLPSIWRNMERK